MTVVAEAALSTSRVHTHSHALNRKRHPLGSTNIIYKQGKREVMADRENLGKYNTDIKTSSSGLTSSPLPEKPQKGNMSDDEFKEAFYDMAQSFQALRQTVRGKQSSNNSIKQCYYCSKNGHIQSEYRKKKFDEANKTVSNAHTHASNDSSVKYNPKVQYSQRSRDMRCFFCNIKNHRIAECRFYNGNGGTRFKFCRYCKCAGHVIEQCRKKMLKEQNGNRDKLHGQPGTSNYKLNLRK